MSTWTTEDSADLYGLPRWGRSFLDTNERGHLVVTPDGDKHVDLKVLVDDLVRRGIEAPLLLRFSDLLQQRLDRLAGSFHEAIRESGYGGSYRGVYPIKVNQQRQVVEELVALGRKHHFGLEAGSKPELLIILALLDDPDALIICNGYKDEGYIELATVAQKLDRHPVIVIEKPDEIPRVIAVHQRTGIRPRLGVRAKLVARGTGRWENSSGDRAKFGLTMPELVAAVDTLREAGLLDCLELLHFHIGSQVSAIRSFKTAMVEAGRLFVELSKLGAPMRILDVGGGLGVDYDGWRANHSASINYSMQEYANDVVWAIRDACDGAGLPHPTLVTEAGRAMVAHHAVLVFDVLGVSQHPAVGNGKAGLPPGEDPAGLGNILENLKEMDPRNIQEAWHDALAAREDLNTRFKLGLIDLRTRARGEQIFWQVLHDIQERCRELDEVPPELAGLSDALADTYFCNFSVFQSMPDAWAIDQLFPMIPIQRLDEEPVRRGVLADITCDSDGKLSRFITHARRPRPVLPLHPPDGKPYYIAAFMVGAYQEILGDLHNLFGDTNAVVVSLGEDGSYELEDVQEGDRVTDVLGYVAYSRSDLIRRIRRACESAARSGKMRIDESRWLVGAYQQGLEGYTYLAADES